MYCSRSVHQLTPFSMPRGKLVGGGSALRSGRHQQVWKTVREHAEEGRRRVLPLVEQLLAADARDVDEVIGAGDGVKTGGIDDDVELVVARRGAQAFFGDRSIGVLLISTRCTLSRL